MAGDGGSDREAARRLHDLAMEFAARARRSQADLIREFEAVAGPPMATVGVVLVDDDDDENLVLQADGHFVGRMLDDETGRWEPISSPEEVAEHYDPGDLFADLADAIAEMFPDLGLAYTAEGAAGDPWGDAPPERWVTRPEAADVPDQWITPGYDWSGSTTSDGDEADDAGHADQADQATRDDALTDAAAVASTDSHGADGPNAQQIRVLEDLMNAGVMTKEQFEAAKAKLLTR